MPKKTTDALEIPGRLTGDDPELREMIAEERLLDDSNAWKETLYLLSNPANAEHLRRSIAEAQAGNVDEHELLDT